MADDYSYYGGGLEDFESSLSGWNPSSYVMPEAYSQDYYDYLTNVGQTNPELIRAFFKEYPQEASQLFGPDAALAMGEGREGMSVSPSTTIGDEELKSLGAGLGLSDVSPSLLKSLLGNKNLLSAGLGGLGALLSYKSAKDAMQQAKGAKFESRGPTTATRTAFKGTKYSAAGGGIGSLDMAQGGRALPPRYLDGHSDGMADKVPADIDGKRPAALSDGEFVIPADVVSHLGNGNSNAGAKRLYKMMDDIRAARTGNPKQGKQINPDKFMPR